jgi:hypothetical protein
MWVDAEVHHMMRHVQE